MMQILSTHAQFCYYNYYKIQAMHFIFKFAKIMQNFIIAWMDKFMVHNKIFCHLAKSVWDN